MPAKMDEQIPPMVQKKILTPVARHVEQFIGSDADVIQGNSTRGSVVLQPALDHLW